MNFYNMNKTIGLAQNIDIDDPKYDKLNILTVSDNCSEMLNGFLYQNIKRKLGSYVIFDYNDNLYNNCKSSLDGYGYEIERWTIDETFNVFSAIQGEEDIINLSKCILNNSGYIMKFFKSGKRDDDKHYEKLKLLLNLVLVYLHEKAPAEKQNFEYLKKIFVKFAGRTVEDFNKIFGGIDSSYKIHQEMYWMKYLKNDEFTDLMKILSEITAKLADTSASQTSLLDKIEYLYSHKALKLVFVKLTGKLAINSFACTCIENNCNLIDAERKSHPIFYVYAPLEKSGYVPVMRSIITSFDRRNDVHIFCTESLAKFIQLYRPDVQKIMKEIKYGIFFQTSDELNMKYAQKLFSDTHLPDLINQIAVNPSYFVLVRNGVRSSTEKKMVDDEDIEKEDSSAEDVSSSEDSSVELKKYMDTLETKDDLIAELKKDIENEKDSIKKQHFVNLYDTFAN